MRTVTATELARDLREVLDRVTLEGQEIIVKRNHRQVARILPDRGHQTALEAMADLYRTLPAEAGTGWLADTRVRSTGAEQYRQP